MDYRTKFSIETILKDIEKARKANLNFKRVALDESEKAYYQGSIEAYDYVISLFKQLNN